MLNNEIIKIMEELESDVENLYNVYNYLCNLEIQSKNNTKEYEEGIKLVKSALKIERKHLDFLLNPDYIDDVYRHFSEKYNLAISLYVSPFAKSDKLKQTRIMNQFYIDLYKMLPDEVYEGYEFSSYLYQLNIHLDLLRLTISLLAENNIEEAIKLKYNLSFTLADIESELLYTNFTITENPYLVRDVLLYSSKLKERGEYLTNNLLIETLNVYLQVLFSIDDSKDKKESLFLQSSIRACLAMLDQRTSNIVINKISDFLNGEGDYNLPENLKFNKEFLLALLTDLTDSLENCDDAKYMINKIESLIEKTDDDRTLPKHVSLIR